MRKNLRFTRLAVWACWIFILSAPAMGQDSQFVPSKLNSTQESAEGVDVEIEVGNDGSVIAVRIVECEGCQHTTFFPAPEIAFKVGGEAATVSEAVSFNGRAGTVFYNSHTHLAEKVIIYGF